MGKVTVVGGKVGMNVPKVGLPNGYTELEYIQSSGTQYIDTGFVPNQDTRVVADLIYPLPSGTSCAFGAITGTTGNYKNFSFMGVSTGYRNDYGSVYPTVYAQSITDRFIVDKNKGTTTINGVSNTVTYTSFSTGCPLYIFARDFNNVADSFAEVVLYAMKIYDNGTLVRDFVPCVTNKGDIGLYDKVNQQFYGNSGTGTFIAGYKPTNDGILASDISVGSTVKLMENGSPVEYLVVNQGIPSNSNLYDASCNGTWLLRKNWQEEKVWDTTNSDYKNSDVHSYLNNNFINTFDADTKNAIKQVKIPYVNGTGKDEVDSGSNGLPTKVFLLSCEEIGWVDNLGALMDVPADGACLDYFKGLSLEDAKRICYNDNGVSNYWLLRSPDPAGTTWIWFVDISGGPISDSCTDPYAVRPCVIIPSNTIFDESTLVLKGV